MNKVTLVPKIISREVLTANGSTLIPRNRELIIESDMQEPGNEDSIVYRFKIGNGLDTYKDLPYTSSLYSLFPKISFYDSKYENGLTLLFKEPR